jgi:ABC-type branched-subunit amino acid transport system ATPase component
MLDEPSLGLAPSSSRIFEIMKEINSSGQPSFGEQNVAVPVAGAPRRLENGRIKLEGPKRDCFSFPRFGSFGFLRRIRPSI